MEQEELKQDTLFVALTRPAMFHGVPAEATLLILFVSGIFLIATGNPIYMICLAVASFFSIRLIVRKDYNMFRLLLLYSNTKLKCRNRMFWGGSSYSPLKVEGVKRKGFRCD